MRKVIMLIMAVALMALPAMAQQEQWQTSTMQTSGSAYSSQVTPVGATVAPSEATTTANYAPNRPGQPRKSKDDPGEVEPFIDPGSPIGEPWVLAIFATAFAGVIAVRRRRTLNR